MITITFCHLSVVQAQRIVTAHYHPDTGDRIPAPFRMSGYVAFNGPVSVAMVASSGTPALLFWNWVNQSQNALVNYYNRNAASSMVSDTFQTLSIVVFPFSCFRILNKYIYILPGFLFLNYRTRQ